MIARTHDNDARCLCDVVERFEKGVGGLVPIAVLVLARTARRDRIRLVDEEDAWARRFRGCKARMHSLKEGPEMAAARALPFANGGKDQRQLGGCCKCLHEGGLASTWRAVKHAARIDIAPGGARVADMDAHSWTARAMLLFQI